MNERMAHFLTAPYMSIYYNAGSAEIPPRTEGETGRERLFFRLHTSCFLKSGVKVNAAKRKMPTARAVINKPLSNLENRAISFAVVPKLKRW